EGAAAGGGPEGLAADRVVHRAGDHHAVRLGGHRHRVLRQAVQVVDGAVDRVHQPAHPGVAGPRAALLAEDRVARPQPAQLAGQELLGGPGHGGPPVGRGPLGLRLQPGPVQAGPGPPLGHQRPGPAGQVHRDRQQLLRHGHIRSQRDRVPPRPDRTGDRSWRRGGRPVAEATGRRAFGIDVGGSGIKGALVDVDAGRLLTERVKLPTPAESTPDAVGALVATLVRDAGWQGLVGATFPAGGQHGGAGTAGDGDKSWIGTNVDDVFTRATGQDVTVLNDADAAGLAEVRFGAARGVPGVVLVLTFGTGIGSGLFLDGQLVPNTELGHLELDGYDAETRAAASVRDREDLSWPQWARRVPRYPAHAGALFTPDLVVVGGGVSRKADKWVPLLHLRAPVKPAELQNQAGIVGAALAAVERRGT